MPDPTPPKHDRFAGNPKQAAAKTRNAENNARREEVQNGKLKPLATEINARFEKANKAITKANDHRVAAAIRLAEAKVICKENHIDFKKWAEANFTQSWGELGRLVTAGNADDPRKAIEDMRLGARNRMQKTRDRRTTAPPTEPTISGPTADDALHALEDTKRLALISDHAFQMGMTVISLGAAPAKAVPSKNVILEDVMKGFEHLAASDKMALLKWAAETVGAEISFGFETSEPVLKAQPVEREDAETNPASWPGGVLPDDLIRLGQPEPDNAGDDEDMLDIPDILRRT